MRPRPIFFAIIPVIVTLLLAGAFAPLVFASLIQRGDLFVTFDGGISPTALPRREEAPISVSVSGEVRTLPGSLPPALRHITVELNRAGHLDTKGLPICRVSQIEASSSGAAMAACRSALVGAGSFSANVAFPEQPIISTQGRILAFNGREGSHPVILANIYGTNPVSITRIMIFHLHHVTGGYGTIFSGALPPEINHYGYVTHIELTLHRTFTYRGVAHSYLSAACPAPAGFTTAFFPFARASMVFADGRILSSTLTRSCHLRG